MGGIYQVAELKQLISRSLKPMFYSITELHGFVTVEGVLERVSRYPSGIYLVLKDAETADVTINCQLAPERKIDFELKKGLKVQAVGTVEMRTRKNNADYGEVIQVTQLFEVGKGEAAEMEALRKELQEMGYFQDKKPMPRLNGVPLKVCVISSVDGVAYRDIETPVKNANADSFQLELFPANLYSPEDIAKSIGEADLRGYDMLIVSRGGGPRLDVFNQVPLLAAVKNANTPVLIAVGHAQDNTLAEEVADRHAATPTAAGEFLVQMHREYIAKKNEESVAAREKKMDSLIAAHMSEQERLKKLISEQDSLLKAMTGDRAERDRLALELEGLKKRLQSAETAKKSLRLTPGFVLFCLAMLAAIYFILR